MDNETDLIKYLPEFLREYAEYKAICDVENGVLDDCKEGLDGVYNEMSIGNCSSDRLEYYEELYDSFNTDNMTEDERRNLLTVVMQIRGNPFTKVALYNLMTWFGVGFEIEYDTQMLILTVSGTTAFKNTIQAWANNWLRYKIPASMAIGFILK